MLKLTWWLVDSGNKDLRSLTLMCRYLIVWHPLKAKISSETRDDLKACLQSTNSRSGACFLYSTCPFGYRGLAHEVTTFYKKLTSLLTSKWNEYYSSMMCWLRCCLNFTLLRSALQCFHGLNPSCGTPITYSAPVTVMQSKTRFN